MRTSRFTDSPRSPAVPRLALIALLAAMTSTALACPEGVDGHFEVTLSGALVATIDWQAPALHCEGMPRPDAGGGRLRFSGELEPGVDLAVVIGIDGLAPGVKTRELPANLTLVVEGQGLFFGSMQQSHCWADILANEPVGSQGHLVRGEIYCVRGLPQVGGGASVGITDLRFVGLLAPEADDDDDDHASLPL
ncbi:MAG: hypothetical protein JJU27_15265 [Gammaproteobacteria bacterium]|nr:hypothetical protein [Gammaproteobacteria bacterium]